MKLRLGLYAIFLFLLDFFSKSYVYQHVPPLHFGFGGFPYGGIAVFHDVLGINFSINYAVNKGAAWGMFSSFPHLLLYFRIAVVAGLLAHLFFFNKEKNRVFPLALIATGAVGNIFDVFLRGHVVDMFYFTFGSYSYPVFNVADATIFCGVALLFLKSLFVKKCID